MSQGTDEKDYVLGTHDEEIARLGIQHGVWRDQADEAWRRGGFTAGQRLIDLGCGPGYASLDLAEIVGSGGRVLAVDRSRRFLDALERVAGERGLSQIETLELDLDKQDLPVTGADGIWSRWVYAFVREPRRLLQRAAGALRPGGVMVMHEYLDYRAWRSSPRSPDFEAFVDEVIQSWRATGGEPDIGLDLPQWLSELGFAVRSLTPLVHITRPGDRIWPWPKAFVEVGIRRMVDLGQIPEARARDYNAAFARVESTPCGFQITPTVIEVVAVKES